MGNKLGEVLPIVHPTVAQFLTSYDRDQWGSTNRNIHQMMGQNEVEIRSSAMTNDGLNSLFQAHPHATNLIIQLDDNLERVYSSYPYPTRIRRVTIKSDPNNSAAAAVPTLENPLATLTQSIYMLDITDLDVSHTPMIYTLYNAMTPPMNRSKELRLRWNQLQWMGEHATWKTQFLAWVSSIHVAMDYDPNPSVECIKWLHEWANESNQVRRLTWVIALWTSVLTARFEEAQMQMDIGDGKLNRFHLIVRGQLHPINGRDLYIFSLFVGELTSVIVSLRGNDLTFHSILWMQFLQYFSHTQSLVTYLDFRCDAIWNTPDISVAFNQLVCDYAWMIGEDILNSGALSNQNIIYGHSIVYDVANHVHCLQLSGKVYRLHMTIRVPSTEMITNPLSPVFTIVNPTFKVLVMRQMIEQGYITLTLKPIFTPDQLDAQYQAKRIKLRIK